jgi:hypothetical protein
MDSDRNKDTNGQGHRWTGTGTQMDKGRDPKRQGKGHKWIRTKPTLTDNLQKNLSVESVKF